MLVPDAEGSIRFYNENSVGVPLVKLSDWSDSTGGLYSPISFVDRSLYFATTDGTLGAIPFQLRDSGDPTEPPWDFIGSENRGWSIMDERFESDNEPTLTVSNGKLFYSTGGTIFCFE